MRLTVAAVVVLSMLAAGVGASARTGYQPIQGAWRFEGGAVLVQPVARHQFRGIVIRKTKFGTCTHPNGQVMWRILGTGRSYTGSHLYFKKSLPCAVDRPGKATWRITRARGSDRLFFCSAEPGTGPPGPGNPTTLCHSLRHAAVPTGFSRRCGRLSSRVSFCLRGPSPLRKIACLPRSAVASTFVAYLTGAGASQAQVSAVSFRLDSRRLSQRGRTVSSGRRVDVFVRAARFKPGRHLLRAVTRFRGARRTFVMNVWVCD